MKNFMKNKFNYIFIPIIFSEIYYLKGSISTNVSSIDIYVSGLFNLYSKGIIILIFLLMLYLLVNYFEKNIVLLRYKNLDLWVREIFNLAVKYCTYIIITINIIPVLFTLVFTNYTFIDIIIISMYIINQLATFYIMAFIYIILFVINGNKIYNFIAIFFVLYAPKYLLDALRKNYITPVDFLFFNRNIELTTMLIQTNIMIIISAIIIYLVQSEFINNKHKDLIWRD